MEFCSNRTLKDEMYTPHHALDEERAWSLIRDILEGNAHFDNLEP